ncbi:hypothetical protein ANN_15550 [Periplaneta americana]|uniref:Uncharacterized protein n=1 Tax=Periplaneta americana TaxID=6978 RepID=A0ABQ8SHI6_PERAM|nr:hypothetical protein ANN_15550 [Periplaneta americana]
MDLREVGYDDIDWINLAQDEDRWRAYVCSTDKLSSTTPWRERDSRDIVARSDSCAFLFLEGGVVVEVPRWTPIEVRMYNVPVAVVAVEVLVVILVVVVVVVVVVLVVVVVVVEVVVVVVVVVVMVVVVVVVFVVVVVVLVVVMVVVVVVVIVVVVGGGGDCCSDGGDDCCGGGCSVGGKVHYTGEALRNATEPVRNGFDLNEAAKKFGVLKATLASRNKYPVEGKVFFGPRPVLGEAICNNIREMTHTCF